MQCPYAEKDLGDCSMEETAQNEEHLQFHLDYAVTIGELVRNEDGTYSLPGG